MQKRMNELYRIKFDMPLILLDKPVQKGWKKGFKLRDDIARRRDAKDIQRILGAINSFVYCARQDFKAKKFHNNQKEDLPHNLKHIPEKSWEKMAWPEHFKKWFDFATKVKHGYMGTSYEIKGYFFKFPWMFEPEITPNMLTHRKEVNPNVERELKEIKQFLNNNEGWERLANLRGGFKSKWDKYDTKKSDLIEDQIAIEAAKEFEENFLISPE